jgi:type III secretion protein Q
MSSSTRPARFPRYSRQHIRLANLISTRRPLLPVAIAGELTGLRLTGDPEPLTGGQPFVLTLAGTRLGLQIGDTLFAQLSAAWGGEPLADDLPAPLQHALLGSALKPLLTALTTLAGGAAISWEAAPQTLPAVAEQALPAVAEQALPLGLWSATLSSGQPAAMLWLDDAAVMLFSAALDAMPVAAAEMPVDASLLPADVIVEAGRMQLSAGELEQLEVADVLLLAPQLTPQDHLLILRQQQRPLAAARLDGHTLIIERLMENIMYENDAANAADSELAIGNPQELEVRISFDLGHLTLSLADLQNLQPGYSFELDLPAGGQVRISCGDQLLGRGELVQIEDRLGVRVTTLFQATVTDDHG